MSSTYVSKARLATLVVAAGLALAACDRATPASNALRTANIKLQALAPNGTDGPSAAARDKVYNEVLTSLKPVADQGKNGETAAAYLLIAQTQCGLADTPAAEASAEERMALNDIQAVRDGLSQWLQFSAIADAASSYDPSKELADIDALIKEKQDLRLAKQQKKAGVDNQVTDLQRQAKEKMEQAKARRLEAGNLKSQLSNQTATQAEVTLKQAQEIGRKADALEVEAANFDAKAAQIAPESGEIQLQIDELTSQKDLLEQAKASVNKRAQDAQAHAKGATDQAKGAADTIQKLVGQLDARRDGDLATATEKAATGFKAASGYAKKAIADAKGPSQMTSGSAQQALGDVMWGKARGLATYAELMDTLAAAKPALPQAAQYKTKADQARTAAKAALDEATDAYTAAKTAYKVGGGAQLRDRIESVNKRLRTIVKITSNGSKDIGDPDEKEDVPATGDVSGGAPAIAPGSAAAALDAILDSVKSGRVAALGSYIRATDPADQKLLGSLLAIADKAVQFNSAVKSKFGKDVVALSFEQFAKASKQAGAKPGAGTPSFPGLAGGDPKAMYDGAMAQLQALNSSAFKIEEHGDTALVFSPGQTSEADAMTMKKVDGKWVIDLGALESQLKSVPNGDKYKELFAAFVPQLDKAISELKQELASNAYSSPELLFTGINIKLLPIAMQAMQKAQELGLKTPSIPGMTPPGGK